MQRLPQNVLPSALPQGFVPLPSIFLPPSRLCVSPHITQTRTLKLRMNVATHDIASQQSHLHITSHKHSRYLITIVAPPTKQLETLSHSLRARLSAIHGHLLHTRPLAPSASEVLVSLPNTTDIYSLRQTLFKLGKSANIDITLQEEAVARCRKRLAVFDLDSTLIRQETVDELASELNVQSKVAAITHQAMNGEICFSAALAQRVALLKGLPIGALQAVKDRVNITQGAFELVRTLSRLGCQTAVVSGGFHFLADHVRDVLGLDYSFANRLEVDQMGFLTGRTVGPVVDGVFKEQKLLRLAAGLSLQPRQILAVGDGSNDLLMMQSAGLGVAFNAKPLVQHRAKCRVNQSSLRNVLYLLSLSDSEIDALLR